MNLLIEYLPLSIALSSGLFMLYFVIKNKHKILQKEDTNARKDGKRIRYLTWIAILIVTVYLLIGIIRLLLS